LKRESKYIEERRNTSLPMVMVTTGPARERKEDGDCWSDERKKEEDGNLRKADKARAKLTYSKLAPVCPVPCIKLRHVSN
jgi:hypothetical protein